MKDEQFEEWWDEPMTTSEKDAAHDAWMEAYQRGLVAGAAREWQDIASAPKDGTTILLYWPSYAYGVGEKSYPLVAFGSWKTNPRISKSYFSDSGEMDDYGLAQTEHAPTHWMAYHLPAAPVSEQEKVG